MGGCENKRFRDMLHAYELGRLSDEEQEELEQHLLECDDCFREFSEFQKTVAHLRFSPRVKKAIVRLAREERARAAGSAKKTKLRPFWAPVSLIAVLAVIILILKPWHLEFHPAGEAKATENRLAVLPFENLVDDDDPDRLAEIAASLLITDLTDSRHIRVISSQRIFDIMNRLGIEQDALSDPDVVSRIARESGAQWLLAGKIVQIEPAIVIAYEISDVKGGYVVSGTRLTGEKGETIFAIVDRLTVEVRNSVYPDNVTRPEPDRLVADITTHSAEAYRYYLSGVENLSKFYLPEALSDFHRSLDYDSTFAMAYYYLSRYEKPEYIDQAIAYSDRTTRLGQYYIESQRAAAAGDVDTYIDRLRIITEEFPDEKMAFYDMGVVFYNRSKYEDAKDYILKAIAIDPNYKEAINTLAYVYNQLGEFENSLLMINRYISLVPGEPNPYDSRGDLYAFNGRLDKAIESYEKALEIKPDYFESLRKLGHLYLYQRKFALADSCYRTMLPTADSGYYTRRLYPGLIPFYRGNLTQTLALLDSIYNKQLSQGEIRGIWQTLRLKAFAYYQQRDLPQAIDAMKRSIASYYEAKLTTCADDRYLLVQFLAENGDLEAAGAIVDSLRIDFADSEKEIFRYWYAVGALAAARGDSGRAIDAFEMAEKLSVNNSSRFSAWYTLGKMYVERGEYEKAVAVLSDIISDYEESLRLHLVPWNVKAHYYLGLAYENSKWYQKAMDQYRIFLEFWDGADAVFEEVADARARLARLQKNP